MKAHVVQSSLGDRSLELSSQHSQENTRNRGGAVKVARKWQGKPSGGRGRFGKNDPKYWRKRIFKPRDGRKGDFSPHYSVRIQFQGNRQAICLGTGNPDASAIRARNLYQDAVTMGLPAAVQKLKPESPSAERIATVGEWITAAQRVSSASKATLGLYAVALRLIVGQVISAQRSRKRFAPGKGKGASAYRAKIDAASLDVLTPQAVQIWRLAYVAQAKNPAEERSRMTSTNSLIRQARSLFSEKIRRFLPELILPNPLPFASCEFYPRQSTRYFSKIDAPRILQSARDELAEMDPASFLVILLALSAGLRKGEIDTLTWSQIDFDRAVVRVENTAVASLKTVDSRGEVPIDPGLIVILRGFRARANSLFVIDSATGAQEEKAWGRTYRAAGVFARVYRWLRENGIDDRKPLHLLRKELGAMVTTKHGLFAASQILRHSDVATTARHYADQKTRPTLPVASWLAAPVDLESAEQPVREGKSAA
jgi:integrase